MNLVFFTHPSFFVSQSMPRFANMLIKGMIERGHTVEVWTPLPTFFVGSLPFSIKKWLGYIDQYILFPRQIRKKLKNVPKETLFVFTDQALGPWVPMVKDKFHVIHCHDFLAQRSALGEIPENPISKSGQMYQAFIRKGYQQGKNFISVSKNTKADLERFLKNPPHLSEVVYNGMNQNVQQSDIDLARKLLGEKIGINLTNGYFLHVGGNLWYKNRVGVIDLYNYWRSQSDSQLPLILIGEAPDETLQQKHKNSSYKNDIHFITNADDSMLGIAYSGASLFLFPSLAEGFGWPIAEAMAHGCPVITTGEAPMSEVAGDAGFFIPIMSGYGENKQIWEQACSNVIESMLVMSEQEKQKVIEKGFSNAKRFDRELALNQIEEIYKKIAGREV